MFTHDIDPDILFNAMEHKWNDVHGNKGGQWKRLTLQQALDLLKAEVKELEDAINSKDHRDVERVDNIILESADVSNFAMICANLAQRQVDNLDHKGAGSLDV